MPRFRLLGGSHVEGEKVYRRGDIVQTSRNLVSMFGRGNFELVRDPSILPTKAPRLDEDPGPTKTLKQMEEEQKKLRAEEDARLEAEVLEEVKKEQAKEAANDPGAMKLYEEETGQKDNPQEDTEPDFGEDVTELFPDAMKAEFFVFQKDKLFFVVETDSPTKPIHEEPLKSKKAVTEFIGQFVNS